MLGEFALVVSGRVIQFSNTLPDSDAVHHLPLTDFESLASMLCSEDDGSIGGKYKDPLQAACAVALIAAGEFDERQYDQAIENWEAMRSVAKIDNSALLDEADVVGLPNSADSQKTDSPDNAPADSDSSRGTKDAGGEGRETNNSISPVLVPELQQENSPANVPDSTPEVESHSELDSTTEEQSTDVIPTAPALMPEPLRDLTITDISAFKSVGKVERYQRNVRAITLLKALEEEGRIATHEEQLEIALYTGWGALAQELFQGTYTHNAARGDLWKKRADELRAALTKDEWDSAKNSTVNAHYTSPEIVQAMWGMVKKLGFKGGRISDPAIGLGNFISMMPRDLREASSAYGGELDNLTAGLVKHVLPDTKIKNIAYQQDQTPDDFYSLVVGNWPFLNMEVADRRYGKFKPVLHDYFFLKAIDQTVPGGLVAAVTSAGTLDKRSSAVRKEMSKSAEFVTAIRLPTGAFNGYAGTDVVTDIVILRKRSQKLKQAPQEAWLDVGDFAENDDSPVIKVNQFFLDNPQNVLGNLCVTTHTTYNRAGMGVNPPGDLAVALQNAIETLIPEPVDVVIDTPKAASRLKNSKRSALALDVEAGRPVYRYGDEVVDANEICKYVVKSESTTKARAAELVAIVGVRDAYDELRSSLSTGNTEGARAILRERYEAYVAQFGPLRKSFGLKYLKSSKDSAYVRLASLEGKEGNPSLIIFQNTVRQAPKLESPSIPEAYIMARQLATEPTISDVAAVCRKSPDEVLAYVLDNKMYYKSGENNYTPADLFLSGDVRRKAKDLAALAEAGVPGLEDSVAALKKIVPPTIPFYSIEARLGARWVPDNHYREFIADMLKISTDGKEFAGISVKSNELGYSVSLDDSVKGRSEANSGFGSQHRSFGSLVEAAIANRTITIKRTESDGTQVVDQKATDQVNDCITRMREHFSEWVWKDLERRSLLEETYNELRNSWVNPVLDGSFMHLEGCSLLRGTEPFNLRKSQLNAAWKGIVNRKGMYNHEVGTGKTYTMGMIAIESAKYGICSKPLLFAHNANSEAVALEISAMYPMAKILYVDNLDRATKKIKINQIANEHWDLIVLPHSLISSLSLKEESLREIAQEQIDLLESELEDELSEKGMSINEFDIDDEDDIRKMRSVTAKELAKARLGILELIRKQSIASSEEDAISFEELGIDMILVDEVHEFKKPPIATRMQMKGLNRQVSQRATALSFLTTYVRNHNNGGNVHTFSGTMITNTLTELYHQMGYVMKDEMVDAGVGTWDSWFNSFADAITDVELDSAGEYKMTTRLAGFVNLPELSKLCGRYMDTVWSKDMPEMQPRQAPSGRTLTSSDITEGEKEFLLNGRTEDAKDRPYIKTVNVMAELTLHQEIALAKVAKAAKAWSGASGKEKLEWMRSGAIECPIIYEQYANKAGLDTRLLGSDNAGQEGKIDLDHESKVYKLLTNLIEIYESDSRACQAVFSDLGSGQSSTRTVNHGGEKSKVKVATFSTIVDLIERLKAYGIPDGHIAFINGKTSPEMRTEIARRMNSGEIRIVFASTATGGVGVNMQRNLKAIHHLDAPYMPGDLWQRIGRAERSGNQWNTVMEFRYITSALDARRWQILAVKERFIRAFFSSNGVARTLESDSLDEDESILKSFSEAAGDPRLLQRVKLTKKVDQLLRRSRVYDENILTLTRSIDRCVSRQTYLKEAIARHSERHTIDELKSILQSTEDNLRIIIDGEIGEGKVKVMETISEFAKRFTFEIENKEKFAVDAGSYQGYPLRLISRHGQVYIELDLQHLNMTFEASSIVSLEHRIRKRIEEVAALPDELVVVTRERASYEEEVVKPFPLAGEIAAKQLQLQKLESDIAENPAAPPSWLRSGAPLESFAFFNGKAHVVKGHRYTKDAWLVTVSEDGCDDTFDVDYLALTNENGHRLYGPRPFVPPGSEFHPIETLKNAAALSYLHTIYTGRFMDSTVAAIAEDPLLNEEESKALRSFGLTCKSDARLEGSWKSAIDTKASQLSGVVFKVDFDSLMESCVSLRDTDADGTSVFEQFLHGDGLHRYQAAWLAEKLNEEFSIFTPRELAHFCFAIAACFKRDQIPDATLQILNKARKDMDPSAEVFYDWYRNLKYVPKGQLIYKVEGFPELGYYGRLERFAGAVLREEGDDYVIFENPADRSQSAVLPRNRGSGWETSTVLLKVINAVSSTYTMDSGISLSDSISLMDRVCAPVRSADVSDEIFASNPSPAMN